MKSIHDMSYDELSTEFDCYAAETGMDRELDFDHERDFAQWLEDNEIEIGDED